VIVKKSSLIGVDDLTREGHVKRIISILGVFPLIWSIPCFANEIVMDGDGFRDITVVQGDSIHKDGKGNAIENVKGPIKVWKNGADHIYLIGLNDYSVVEITFKDGDGHVYWVPVDPDKYSSGPAVTGVIQGNGKILQGKWSDVVALRPK
jgi:hypothetical protein